MLMRTFLIVIGVLFFIGTTDAQIVITEETVMPIGVEWLSYTMANLTDVDVGPSGANQTWTFGEYTFDDEDVGAIVDASGTEYADQFPTANCAMMSSGGAALTYYRTAADALYWLGMGSGGTANVFETEACLIPFPCSYGSEWTMVARYDVVFEELTATVTDSIVTEVDGWGTCQTQYGSEEVLRAFSQIFMRTQIEGFPGVESTFLSYVWRTAGGLDYVIITSEEGVTDPNFTTGMLEMSADIESAPPRGPLAESFHVAQNYPNPFNPATALPLELAKPTRVTLSIYDETGRLVSEETRELSAGQHQLNVNGSEWATGTYFARVAAGTEQQTVKMQLVK